ncbi:MAG: hypothetical protein GWN58_32735 [Anaerolineae bacterium]|nr:hypothetical protein [Thermoplasmata archaeon]NIV34042.1 hypothetical protein [Anaerolineae bacterium]NIY05893.1 hypothetical protein [Thermoplasmata archaeon]
MIDKLHTMCDGVHGPFEFAFTVTDGAGDLWDVYRFTKDGVRGSLVFRQTKEGKWIIGLLEKGELTEEQVVRKLNAQRN